METVIEKEEDISRKISSKVTERKSFKIFGISIWRLFAYFIIYSIIAQSLCKTT